MKNATITIDYESFQEIKKKADLYNDLPSYDGKSARILNDLWDALDCANNEKLAQHKQFFIAQAIRKICTHFDLDLTTEYPNLDEGVKVTSVKK